MNNLTWKKYFPLSDQNAFICLVDTMGDDTSIVQAARVSYGKDEQNQTTKPCCFDGHYSLVYKGKEYAECSTCGTVRELHGDRKRVSVPNQKDRQLIRYLMNHQHTTPFEMVEFKFMVQVPMDCWRQWVRHRTASINEYSTRYMEALDFFQVTSPQEWRLQATDNKQGSSGFLKEWPEDYQFNQIGWPYDIGGKKYIESQTPGKVLSEAESTFHRLAKQLYKMRLHFGIAKEQARKDLPLSTYTRAYWKCDLHNIFNFLRLRMDSHAQLEIRSFANCMFEIVKQVCPVACEAFEDYVLHAKRFSRMEMELLKELSTGDPLPMRHWTKPSSMTDREWKDFLGKLS